MRKILNFTGSILAMALLSCNAGDCTNGIQDGNETGVDCGGNCQACPVPVQVCPVPVTANSEYFNQDLVGKKWRFVKFEYNGSEIPGVSCPFNFVFMAEYNNQHGACNVYRASGYPGGCLPGISTNWRYYETYSSPENNVFMDSVLHTWMSLDSGDIVSGLSKVYKLTADSLVLGYMPNAPDDYTQTSIYIYVRVE